MRVLLVNNYLYPRGGAERSLFRIADLLRANGHEVIYYACKFDENLPSAYDAYFPQDYQVTGVSGLAGKLGSGLRMIYNREAAENLRRLLRKTQPDIAHLNNIYHHLTPSILPVLAECNMPLVLHLRDGKLVCPAIYMFCREGFAILVWLIVSGLRFGSDVMRVLFGIRRCWLWRVSRRNFWDFTAVTWTTIFARVSFFVSRLSEVALAHRES